MRIAYIDESGTPELTGGTSHFVLVAVSIDGHSWKPKDLEIEAIKTGFDLADAEIHSGWMARRYEEQERIPGIEAMSRDARRIATRKAREAVLLRRAALRGVGSLKEVRKNFEKTNAYIHLLREERLDVLRQVVSALAHWPDATIFADCIDKRVFGGKMPRTPPFEEAFQQVVSRFHRNLELAGGTYGMLVQDQNHTVSERLTQLMRAFYKRGTKYRRNINLLVETPLFVDSRLTSMVQLADICAFALRRYLENGEEALLDIFFPKFATDGGRCVGARHYRGTQDCTCRICAVH